MIFFLPRKRQPTPEMEKVSWNDANLFLMTQLLTAQTIGCKKIHDGVTPTHKLVLSIPAVTDVVHAKLAQKHVVAAVAPPENSAARVACVVCRLVSEKRGRRIV